MKLLAASKQHRHVHTMCTGDQLGQSSFYHKVNRYYLPDIGQCADIAHFKKLSSLHICCLGILNFNNRSIQKNGFLHKIIQVEQASCDKLQCHPLLSLTLSKEYQILFEIPSTKFDCHPNCHHIYHINTMQWAKAVHTLLLLPVILLCTETSNTTSSVYSAQKIPSGLAFYKSAVLVVDLWFHSKLLSNHFPLSFQQSDCPNYDTQKMSAMHHLYLVQEIEHVLMLIHTCRSVIPGFTQPWQLNIDLLPPNLASMVQ